MNRRGVLASFLALVAAPFWRAPVNIWDRVRWTWVTTPERIKVGSALPWYIKGRGPNFNDHRLPPTISAKKAIEFLRDEANVRRGLRKKAVITDIEEPDL